MVKRMLAHPQRPSSQVEATTRSLEITSAPKEQLSGIKIIGYYNPRRQGAEKGEKEGKGRRGER